MDDTAATQGPNLLSDLRNYLRVGVTIAHTTFIVLYLKKGGVYPTSSQEHFLLLIGRMIGICRHLHLDFLPKLVILKIKSAKNSDCRTEYTIS